MHPSSDSEVFPVKPLNKDELNYLQYKEAKKVKIIDEINKLEEKIRNEIKSENNKMKRFVESGRITSPYHLNVGIAFKCNSDKFNVMLDIALKNISDGFNYEIKKIKTLNEIDKDFSEKYERVLYFVRGEPFGIHVSGEYDKTLTIHYTRETEELSYTDISNIVFVRIWKDNVN